MPTARKTLAWLLFAVAMLIWGFLYALVLSIAVHHWKQEAFVLVMIGAVLLLFITHQAYWWVENGPWKLKP